jgi:hypothetical protein
VKKRPRLSASFGAAASVVSTVRCDNHHHQLQGDGLYTGTIHVRLHDDGQEKLKNSDGNNMVVMILSMRGCRSGNYRRPVSNGTMDKKKKKHRPRRTPLGKREIIYQKRPTGADVRAPTNNAGGIVSWWSLGRR